MAIKHIAPLGFPWPTQDPFLFCAHHRDAYPEGLDHLGPDPAHLRGRNMGQDFQIKDGFRMYHGQSVPGFPPHPHRGFETVTIVREGYVDHADSLGAVARFGEGDIQWLTTGKGIVHSEMFPLLHKEKGNPLELFQIWLNLEARNKMASPYFSMYWGESIKASQKNGAQIKVYVGDLDGIPGVTPPPESYAAKSDSELAIYTVSLAAGSRFTLPAARAGTGRMLYFFSGDGLIADGREIPSYHYIALDEGELELESQDGPCELLYLAGRPIGEPVAQYGPFVMNTPQEIEQTIQDYRRTGFGGWPHQVDEPVHGNGTERFARYPDGTLMRPT